MGDIPVSVQKVSTKKLRLTRSADFKRVRRFGKSYAHPFAILIVLPNVAGSETRFGVSAGRSVGNAVQRNRAKRLIRAALSPLIPSILSGWDVVILARRPIVTTKCQDVQEALLTLLRQTCLLKS